MNHNLLLPQFLEKKFADGYIIWQSEFDTNGGRYAKTINYKI